ncbi:indole-3-acetaldehyde oxidase [Tanacetum coccineum]
MPKFSVQTQIDVIIVAFALHNYIRNSSQEDMMFTVMEQHPDYIPQDELHDVRNHDTNNEDNSGGASNEMKQICNDIATLIWNACLNHHSSPPSNPPLSSPPPPLSQGRKSNTDKINNNSRNGYCATWCLHMYLFISRKKKMNRQNLPPLDHTESCFWLSSSTFIKVILVFGVRFAYYNIMRHRDTNFRCREVVPPVQVRISGQGLWTKVKQMTAYCLSAVQCDGADGLLEKVRVIQADTLSMVQGGWTVGITTSEATCEAATSQSVHLSANAYFVPEFTAMRYINYGAAISEIEGAFVQGISFFMLEEYLTNSDGLVVADGTWTYKIPTIDTIPKQLNVQMPHKKRVLSSKASGEPPLLLSSSVHCATRAAIKEARKQMCSWKGVNLDGSESTFQLDVPATMPIVKTLCGLDCVGSGVILDSSDDSGSSSSYKHLNNT